MVTSQVNAFRAQHLSICGARMHPQKAASGPKFDQIGRSAGVARAAEGTDGRPLIEPHQLQAGERLRAEFTMAQMMPRTTSN